MRWMLLVAALLVLWAWSRCAWAGETVRLTFRVEAPEGTRAESLKLVGNIAALGAWKPEKGLRLKRLKGAARVYGATVKVPAGAELAFKVCRVDWTSVEKSKTGHELPNRIWRATADAEVALTVACWADVVPGPGIEAPIALLGHLGERSAGVARPVWVHLPPGYDPERAYPVLYMLDGQNVFDRATAAFGEEWAADEAADALIAAGAIEPLIIVGIGNSPRRMAEYTPDKDARFEEGGELEKTEALIRDEVEPLLAKRHKIKDDAASRGLCGSSLGGLAVFHLALSHPERYGRVAVVSPSFWWNDESSLTRARALEDAPPHTRMWMDMGTNEGDEGAPVRQMRAVAAAMRTKGMDGARLQVEVVEDGGHSEPDWRARFPRILRFLYGVKAREDEGGGR